MTHKILNVTKFNNYSEIQQRIFESYRESILLTYYQWNGSSYDDDDLKITELSAFKFTDNFPMDLIEEMIDEKVEKAVATLAPPSPTTTP